MGHYTNKYDKPKRPYHNQGGRLDIYKIFKEENQPRADKGKGKIDPRIAAIKVYF